MANFKRTPIKERFWRQVSPEPNSGCWLWAGAVKSDGYGVLGRGGAATRNGYFLAHRYSYTVFKGDIPKGLVIDHLCRVRCCVNPEHLEAVTEKVNINRGVSAEAIRQRFASMMHCKHGNEFTQDNTYHYTANGYKRRGCKICRTAADRTRKQRKRACHS